tara:strand:+ start:4088 stop:4417 length:330 start_codon:yes stop_codon:yes gene_type:complete
MASVETYIKATKVAFKLLLKEIEAEAEKIAEEKKKEMTEEVIAEIARRNQGIINLITELDDLIKDVNAFKVAAETLVVSTKEKIVTTKQNIIDAKNKLDTLAETLAALD